MANLTIEYLKSKLSLEELKAKCIIVDEHWIWCGARTRDQYAQISLGDKTRMLGRLVLSIYLNRMLADNEVACHRLNCRRNPCINPEHLYAGTQGDNIRDIVKSGNNVNTNKTHCLRGHEYTEINTYISPKTGGRSCKRCRLEANRRRRS